MVRPASAVPVSPSTRRSLAWSHGVVSVETLGGMLGPTLFLLGDGRQIAPFHVAPWFEQELPPDQPGLLRRLRGEWPCVPFGIASDRTAADGWPASATAQEPDRHPHGFGSNHCWRIDEARETELSLAIDYPEEHPISSLQRRIIPVAGRPAIDFELGVNVRADCTLPIGLHPVFRLDSRPGAMRLAAAAKAWATVPGPVDRSSLFAPGQIGRAGQPVRTTAGGAIDPFSLPYGQPTEDLLQLLDADGRATLDNAGEGYRVTLEWNAEHFPSLLLWLSLRGLRDPPWNGRNLALGIEPVCSAFDLGSQISSQPNPINATGTPTSRRFRRGERFITRYRVSVDSAASHQT